MTDHRTGEHRPHDQPAHERDRDREVEAAREPRRDERDRRASPIERREWRGAGVCGDRHTD
jgi:hypothetical protein